MIKIIFSSGRFLSQKESHTKLAKVHIYFISPTIIFPSKIEQDIYLKTIFAQKKDARTYTTYSIFHMR